jgi:hypothetical protein
MAVCPEDVPGALDDEIENIDRRISELAAWREQLVEALSMVTNIEDLDMHGGKWVQMYDAGEARAWAA